MIDQYIPRWLKKWLSPLFDGAVHHSGRLRNPARRRLALEPLETRELLSVSTLINVLTPGDTVTLQPSGQLWRSDANGSQLLDDGAHAIASGVDAAGQPALFDLKINGRLYSLTATGGWALLDDGASAIAAGQVAPGHSVLFDLKGNGSLYAYVIGGWTHLADGVAALGSGVNAAGQPVAYELSGTALYGYDNGNWSLVDNRTSTIGSGMDAFGHPVLFDLEVDGHLYSWTAAGSTLLDDGASAIVTGVNSSGQSALFDLKGNGSLYAYSAGGWSLLDDGCKTIGSGLAADGTRALFDYKLNGQVFSYDQNGWQPVKNADSTPPPGKGLFFQNTTNQTVQVALDHHIPATATTPEAWQVTGWLTVAPGQTVRALSTVDNRYFEYYAYSPNGKTWDGALTLPITYTPFSYNSLDKALDNRLVQPGSGYVVKGFASIDVGPSNVYGSYTVLLAANM